MKIALCFSGQPRYIRESYENIKEKLLYNGNEVDIFAHFWWNDDYIGDVISRGSSNRYTENNRELFKNLYNPVKMICEPYMKKEMATNYKNIKYCNFYLILII